MRRALGGREVPDLPPLARRCETAVRQFQLAMEQKGERIACLEMRRHYAWYLKGVPYASYWKGRSVSSRLPTTYTGSLRGSSGT